METSIEDRISPVSPIMNTIALTVDIVATGESVVPLSHDLGSLNPCRIRRHFRLPSLLGSRFILSLTALLAAPTVITSSLVRGRSRLRVTSFNSALYPGAHSSTVPALFCCRSSWHIASDSRCESDSGWLMLDPRSSSVNR